MIDGRRGVLRMWVGSPQGVSARSEPFSSADVLVGQAQLCSFSLPLTEQAGVSLTSALTTGPFTPITGTGTAAEKYTGAALCGVPQGKLKVVKPVTKGTFSGSPAAKCVHLWGLQL